MQMALTLLSLLYPSLAETRAVPRETTSPEYSKLRDKDPLHRIEAILDIASKKPRPETAAALVYCIINDDNSYVRLIASDVLTSMRAFARDLAPRMLAMLEDHAADAGRRARAAQVLGAIGGEAPKSIGPLIDILEDTREPSTLREAVAQ
jgi:hypothetical protein